jgi:phage tail-like protein
VSVQQLSSLATLATDPLRNFKFVVTISPPSGAAIHIGFMSVSGFNINIDVIAYREGGYNTTTQKMPGQADFSPITFSRGVIMGNTVDVDWLTQLFTVIQGTGSTTPGTDFRRTVDVQVLDHPVTSGTVNVKAWFRIYNAWPTSVSWSDLDAGANQLLIEQMSLAHEGFDYTLATSIGASDAPNPPSPPSTHAPS